MREPDLKKIIHDELVRHLDPFETRLNWGFARVEAYLRILNRRSIKMAGELVQLVTEVTETNTLIDSAITLIQGIKEALDAAIASGDPAQLSALSAALDAKQQELAAAIAANTPQAPPTP